MDRGPPPHYPGYLACEPAARSLFGCAASSTVSLPVGARWPPWPSWNHGGTSNDGIERSQQLSQILPSPTRPRQQRQTLQFCLTASAPQPVASTQTLTQGQGV